MAGKGGGAWKVAYADFVTAMMAFFLVMWITAQNKAVKESVAQYFENPLGTSAEARATSVHGIPGASALEELEGEQAGPHGSRVRESGAIVAGDPTETSVSSRPQLHIFERLDRTRSIGTMIVFPVDSVELNDEAKLQLAELAIELRGKPNKVEVRGHAIRGPLPTGSPHADAWAVSYARSLNAMNYLMTRGIEPERFRLSQDGAFEPYSDEGNEVKDPRNARVEIFAVSELSHKYKRTVEQRAGDFVPAPDQPVPAHPTDEHADAGHDSHAASGHGGHGAAPAKGSHGSGGHGAAPVKGSHGSGAHGAAPAKESHGGGHGSSSKAKPAAKKATGHGSSGHADSSHGGGHGGSHKAEPAAKKAAAHGSPAKSGGH